MASAPADVAQIARRSALWPQPDDGDISISDAGPVAMDWLRANAESQQTARNVGGGQVTLIRRSMKSRVFLAIGFALGFIALFWLRRTGQMRLW